MTPPARPELSSDESNPRDHDGAVPDMVEARQDDDPFLFDLYCTTRADEIAAWNWPAAEVNTFLQMQHRAQRESYAQQYPEATNQIVVWRGARIGRVLTARTTDAIALIDLAILPGYRNQGLGTALICKLQELARTERRGVRLHVLMYSPARRLYARLGFREEGGSPPYVAMSWSHGSAESAPASGPRSANAGRGGSVEETRD